MIIKKPVKVYSPDMLRVGEEVEEYTRSLGAELYGVASAEAYACEFPDKPQPIRFIAGAKSVIVLGLAFSRGTMDTVLRPELANLRRRASEEVVTRAQPVGAERFFLAEENAVLSRELQLIAYRLARRLESQGQRALVLPNKQDPRFRTAPFYFMPAMYLAGLGTLGLSCSIITPQFGPRVYVTAVITDLDLPAGEPLTEELCDHCQLCVENCPVGAPDGQGWKNVFQCASYGCCSTCLAICPKG